MFLFTLFGLAPDVITLMGRGLNNTVNSSAAFCRFKVNSLTIYGEFSDIVVTYTYLAWIVKSLVASL